MSRKDKASSTVECPICKSTLVMEDHPTNPTHQVARCSCRGDKVIVIDRVKAYTSSSDVEEEVVERPNYKFYKENK